MVYERADSWYSDGAKTSDGEAHPIRIWIWIPYPERPAALTYRPFEKLDQLDRTGAFPETLTQKF